MNDTSEPIDRSTYDALVAMTGGDHEFVDDLVDTYLTDLVEQLAALDAAVAGGDPTALVRPAHSMKSSSLNVGALELGRLCRELEEQGRAGKFDGAVARVADVHRQSERVRAALLARRAEDAKV